MEGGQGASQMSMIQSNIHEKGGDSGGVMALIEFVKIEGTNPMEQMIGGGIQGAGQGFGSGLGLQNAATMGITEIKHGLQLDLASGAQGVLQNMGSSVPDIMKGEASVGLAQHGQDAHSHHGDGLHAANFNNDAYAHSAQHGHNILGAGVQQLQQCHVNEIFRPHDTPSAGRGHGGHAMGG